VIKVDSSSLIYAIKLNLIEYIKNLYNEIIISPIVKKEVIDNVKDKGYSDAIIAEQFLEQGIIKIHHSKTIIKNLNLGTGEIEIISLAKEEDCPCILDDIKAQKIGIKLNVNLKSIILILLELLKKKIIALKQYNQLLEKYARIVNLSQIELWLYKKLGDLIQ